LDRTSQLLERILYALSAMRFLQYILLQPSWNVSLLFIFLLSLMIIFLAISICWICLKIFVLEESEFAPQKLWPTQGTTCHVWYATDWCEEAQPPLVAWGAASLTRCACAWLAGSVMCRFCGNICFEGDLTWIWFYFVTDLF
jgi:hypothetical protein